MPSTKPFFLALESVLKNRLPPDAFAQVMEESLWEFEGDAVNPIQGKEALALMRLGSICVSFYRAMIRLGIRSEAALETLGTAGERLGWSITPHARPTFCPMAAYFRGKNALPLCRAVFCKSCAQKGEGCGLASPDPEDWSSARAAN